MFKKRINSEELEELKKREELINSYKLVVNALEMQKRIYLQKILPKYGCDSDKVYNIDIKVGKIKEIKKDDKTRANN